MLIKTIPEVRKVKSVEISLDLHEAKQLYRHLLNLPTNYHTWTGNKILENFRLIQDIVQGE